MGELVQEIVVRQGQGAVSLAGDSMPAAYPSRKPLNRNEQQIRMRKFSMRVQYHRVREWIDLYQPDSIGGCDMRDILSRLWKDESGQDIAEYAVMLAVILVIVVGTVRLIGTSANNVFSSVASSMQ